MKLNKKYLAILGVLGVATVAYAATQITVQTPIAVSDGISGDKPKIQRLGDGTLVVVYGDSPAGAGLVYDVKAAAERTARDIFAKWCKPSATKTCNNLADWSAAINVSKSADKLSTGVFDWRGTLGDPSTYPGDIDKPNIKTTGPMMVLTWVSKLLSGWGSSHGRHPAFRAARRPVCRARQPCNSLLLHLGVVFHEQGHHLERADPAQLGYA